MGECLENGRLITGKLSVIRAICGALYDDLRYHGGDEHRVRGILATLIVAIEHDQLDSLFKFLQPWMAQEIERQNAAAVAAEEEPDPDPPHGFFAGKPYPPVATEPLDGKT